MLNMKRAGFLGICCAVVITAAPLAAMAGTQKAVAIKLTQRLTTLSSSGSRVTDVGTSDGTIASASVHGALRAVITIVAAPKFTATGTLFYAGGTLRYTLNGTASSGPAGSLRFRGTGRVTGGTGNYAGAHGSFTGSGTRPAGSFETFTFKGKISYR
jgi:hypothetical protein